MDQCIYCGGAAAGEYCSKECYARANGTEWRVY